MKNLLILAAALFLGFSAKAQNGTEGTPKATALKTRNERPLKDSAQVNSAVNPTSARTRAPEKARDQQPLTQPTSAPVRNKAPKPE